MPLHQALSDVALSGYELAVAFPPSLALAYKFHAMRDRPHV